MSLPTSMMMLAGGMFEKERNISVLYAAANLATSLLLVKPMGIAGVLLGTSVSYITQIVCRIYFFFRYYLQKNSAEYIGDMVQYGVLITMETIGVFHVVGRIYDGRSFARLILAILACVILPSIVNLLLFMKSWRLRSIVRMVKGFIRL